MNSECWKVIYWPPTGLPVVDGIFPTRDEAEKEARQRIPHREGTFTISGPEAKTEGEPLPDATRGYLLMDFGIRVRVQDTCLTVEVLDDGYTYSRLWIFEEDDGDASIEKSLAEMRDFVAEASMIPFRKAFEDAKETPTAPPTNVDASDG